MGFLFCQVEEEELHGEINKLFEKVLNKDKEINIDSLKHIDVLWSG